MNQWSIRVEWTGPPLAGDQAADLAEQLAGHQASVGVETASGGSSAQLAVQARTVRQAFDTAVRAVEAACRAVGVPCTITAVDTATWEEFERRQVEPTVPPLVGPSEIAEVLKVSRQRARELTQTHSGAFTEVARTSNGPLFLRAQVERFAATWERKRTGRPRKDSGV